MSRKTPPEPFAEERQLFRSFAAEKPLPKAHAAHKRKRTPAKADGLLKKSAPQKNTATKTHWTKLEISPAPKRGTPDTAPIHTTPPAVAKDQLPRIKEGKRKCDARLDLHGKTEQEAHAALLAFLQKAVQQQHRTVLIITGKGRGGDGVLRRQVPRWLTAPNPLFKRISGFATAGPAHGGAGAFYLTLTVK